MIIKVFVIGAHGQIGQHLIKLLAARGHQVFAGVRDVTQLDKTTGITPVAFDLEALPATLATPLKGMDAVIFTAGSGGQTGADKTMLVDLDGAIKSMQATEAAGVTRFIIVSALYTDDRSKWLGAMKPYYAGKYYADEWLRHHTNLAYTIIRPGGLTNDQPIDKVQLDTDQDVAGKIARADVATVIADTLENPRTVKRTFNVISGEKLIKNAINDL